MNILVTGASKGLGLHIATELAWNNHFIVGCGRSNFQTLMTTFKYIEGVDFLQPETLNKLDEFLPSTDILINNVGIAYDGLLATQKQSSIEDIIQVNLTSTLLLTKKYIRARLKEKLGGKIINISSIISVRGFSGLAAYSASKAGIDAMTRSLAREMGPKGFRINSVLPGYFSSDMSKGLDESKKDKIIRRTPLGRFADLSDIYNVVEFLISEKSDFITGQSIVVDGGLTV